MISRISIVAVAILVATLGAQTGINGIKIEPSVNNFHVFENELVYLSCFDDNNLHPNRSSISWFGPDGQLVENSMTQYSDCHNRRFACLYLILGPTDLVKREGNYTCRISSDLTDGNGIVYDEELSIGLTVHDTDNHRSPRPIKLYKHQPQVTLKCEQPNYKWITWYHNHEAIYPESKQTKYETYTTVNLKINSITPSDAGTYVCCEDGIDDNEVKKIMRAFHVDVVIPPSIREGPSATTKYFEKKDGLAKSSQVTVEHKIVEVQFNCTVKSDEQADLRWFVVTRDPSQDRDTRHIVDLKKLQPLNEWPLKQIISIERKLELFGGDVYDKSMLTIDYFTDPNWQHSLDEYVCKATNSVGYDSKRYSVVQHYASTNPRLDANSVKFNAANETLTVTIVGPENLNMPIRMYKIRADAIALPDKGLSLPANETLRSSYIRGPSYIERFPHEALVKLDQLPYLAQNLYIEAYNGVSWSKKGAFLGRLTKMASFTSGVGSAADHLYDDESPVD